MQLGLNQDEYEFYDIKHIIPKEYDISIYDGVDILKGSYYSSLILMDKELAKH